MMGSVESQRAVEQQALRNVRTLVDRVEADEQQRRRKSRTWVAILVAAGILPFTPFLLSPPANTPENSAIRKCEVEAMMALTSEPSWKLKTRKQQADELDVLVARAHAQCVAIHGS